MTRYRPAGIDVTTPNIARMYDYFLGGKDNFAADREAADQITAMVPMVPAIARGNRAFLRRAVRFLTAERGIRQFIDIGAGLPTQANVHELAREVTADARVIYVDNDPVVCNHGRALLADDATQIIEADLRHPGEIIDHRLTRALIDFHQPFALLATAVLHFIPDDDDPHGIIAGFREAMADGSYLVITHGTFGSDRDRADPRARVSTDVYSRASAQLRLRSVETVRRMFDGFELVEPGLVRISQWRPTPFGGGSKVTETLRGGVGRKLP